MDLTEFVRESNRIEGKLRDPTWQEIDAHERLLKLDTLTIQDLERFVSVCQPGASLRSQARMNVRVGNHLPLEGGPAISEGLALLLISANSDTRRVEAYNTHIRYETLHPFMDGNGRSGRALWLWMMGGIERAPLGFLHHFYYQTLEAS